MNLRYKNIILTGASSGIGAELLVLLMKYEGSKVIAVARNIEKIKKNKERIIPYSCDLSKKEEIDELFVYASETFGHIDIFIANAGFGYYEKIEYPDWNHIQNIFNLDVVSPAYSMEKFVSQPSNPSSDEICFVATCSVAGLIPLPGFSLYSSTKFALHAFLESYRFEKPDNLHITIVYPVATYTEFFEKAGNDKSTPMPWPRQKAKKVAKAIIRGIKKNKKKVFPSFIFRVFWPTARVFPFILRLFVKREEKRFNNWIKKDVPELVITNDQ